MFEEEPEDKDDIIKNLPVYQKGIEIIDLVERIVKGLEISDMDDLGSDEDAREHQELFFQHHIDYLRNNAMTIPVKIAGAEAADIYDLRMENATIIRKAAREMLTDITGLMMSGFKDLEYLQLLRDEIEEFRILFAEWVKTFDPFNYIIDRWGLFNPPGVNYDDHDPDDDLPFNPADFLGDF